MIEVKDISWAAGFIEGEGSFRGGTWKQGGMAITVAQCEIEPLQKLKGMFGGSITGPRPGKGLRPKPIYYWGIYGQRAAAVAMTIYTFLFSKRRAQAENLILAWKNTGIPYKYRTHCKYGHEFTPENTKSVNGKHRRCIACDKRLSMKRTERRRAKKSLA